MLLESRQSVCSLASRMSRIFAISDIHVDIPENRHLVESWSATDYQSDVLIVAGDVTDNMSLLKTVLTSLTEKFHKVCYVPGNHDLWLRQMEGSYLHENSIAILIPCHKGAL